MSNLNGRIIKPSLAFPSMTEEVFLARVNAIEKAMDGNSAFNAPPVSLDVFKQAISGYVTTSAAAMDGSKKAIEERRTRRAELTVLLRVLGHYVETACKGDMATFLSSGFQPSTRATHAAQPLAQPAIAKIDQGASGQLLVTITPVRKARNYEVQSAGVVDGTPAEWTTLTISRANKAVPFGDLKPGTTYAFRVRAFGVLGHTDWSAPATRMCI